MAPGWLRRLGIVCGTVALLFVALVVVTLMGAAYLVQVPVTLAFGWVPYVVRVLPRARPNWPGVALLAGVLVVLLTAGHAFLAWLCVRLAPPRRWTLRDTGVLLGLTLTLFLTSMAVSGIGHQVGWLLRPGERLVQSDWEQREALERLLGVCNAALTRAQSPTGLRPEDLPIGHPELHVVPLDVRGGRVGGGVLLFPRDPDDLRRRGGFLCAPGRFREVDAAAVAAALAEVRRGAGATR